MSYYGDPRDFQPKTCGACRCASCVCTGWATPGSMHVIDYGQYQPQPFTFTPWNSQPDTTRPNVSPLRAVPYEPPPRRKKIPTRWWR